MTTMNAILKTVKGLCLIIVCLFLTACNQSYNTPQEPPEAVEGVLDLRDWDFEKDGSVNLAGEWGFFWDELLQPDQITSSDQTLFVPVPDIWTNYDIEGATIPPEGYATYTLTVYLPERNMDLFARFGGEEFVILMSDTDSKSAKETAERLRNMIARKPMANSNETDIMVTVSLGVANWHSKSPLEINAILDRADQALYQAKEAGRNRVIVDEFF